MAEQVTTEYLCDRCGFVMGKKPYYGGMGTHRILALSEYAVSSDTLDWKDLCPDCNRYVGTLVSDLRRESRELRK